MFKYHKYSFYKSVNTFQPNENSNRFLVIFTFRSTNIISIMSSQN